MSRQMSTLCVLALVVMGSGLAYSQMGLTGLEDVIKVVCVPRLSREKKSIMKKCDDMIPRFIRTPFNDCIKDALKLSKLTRLPLCYQATDSKKLTTCVQRMENATARMMPSGMDIEPMRQAMLAESKTCVEKVL